MERVFVGRQAELGALQRNVIDGMSSLVIGGRRTGKTELVQRLTVDGWSIAHSDAGAWQLAHEEDALHALTMSLGAGARTREGLLSTIRSRLPLCFVIDEADRILREPWASDLLAWFRWLDGPNGLGSQIAIVLVGGPVLLGYEDPVEGGSPALNNARVVYMRPLGAADIADFATQARVPTHATAARTLAGGHPWIAAHLFQALAEGHPLEEAVDWTHDQCVRAFRLWVRQLGRAACELVRSIPPGGVPTAEFRRGRRVAQREALVIARHHCLIRDEAVAGEARVLPGPSIFLEWLRGAPADTPFDLAISYASEDEPIARAIKHGLAGEFRVFFAPDEEAYLWGEDLNRALPKIYGVAARFVLVLSTSAYVKKHWTLVEFTAARSREGAILVVKFDALPPDMPEAVVYRQATFAQLVSLLDALRGKLRQSAAG